MFIPKIKKWPTNSVLKVVNHNILNIPKVINFILVSLTKLLK